MCRKSLIEQRKKGVDLGTMADVTFGENKLVDITRWGISAAVGVIFVVHGSMKFGAGFADWLITIGIPVEMQVPIALAELVSGILLIVGVLTRIAASVLSLVMLGAIFHVKGASNLTGEGGYELDLILLSACLAIIVAGPGRISIAHVIKRIPRFLH